MYERRIQPGEIEGRRNKRKMEIMKVKKNNLKLLKNPEWFFFRNPDDCKFGSFKLFNSERGNTYLIGRHKIKNVNVIVAKKCKERGPGKGPWGDLKEL